MQADLVTLYLSCWKQQEATQNNVFPKSRNILSAESWMKRGNLMFRY